jgi:hypothetical protein
MQDESRDTGGITRPKLTTECCPNQYGLRNDAVGTSTACPGKPTEHGFAITICTR